jgi:hypothetical protein
MRAGLQAFQPMKSILVSPVVLLVFNFYDEVHRRTRLQVNVELKIRIC